MCVKKILIEHLLVGDVSEYVRVCECVSVSMLVREYEYLNVSA